MLAAAMLLWVLRPRAAVSQLYFREPHTRLLRDSFSTAVVALSFATVPPPPPPLLGLALVCCPIAFERD